MSEFNTISRPMRNGVYISLDELFHPFFLQDQTFFDSFEDFLKNAKITSSAELESKSKEELDAIASKLTNFENWEAFFIAAQDDWRRRNAFD